MGFKPFIYITFITASILNASGTNSCDVRDRDDCVYTVICERHAGSAWTPDCNYDPYVTFIITNSEIDTLTAGFFGSTNFDSRVRVIKSINNTWSTLESFCFRYYSKCLIIDLSGNSLKYIRNEAFRNLLALQSLNLSRNYIESLNQKSFMISESRNTDLRTLDLSNNLLGDLSGDVLSYLPNLLKLYLQNNKIVTITDDCFSNIKNLTVLYLQNNQLTSINMTLINLKSLKVLDLSFNAIVKLSGYEMNRLTSLEFVNMSHNAIEFVEANCFNQAFNLHTVDFSHNRIQSIIENLLFINNINLVYLNLFQNNITRIEDNAFKHNKLTYLNLEKNNICGVITENTFSGLTNITSLNLSNQNITEIKNNAFSDLISLVYLNISSNYIDIIGIDSFANAVSLNVLDISFNYVSNIDFLKNNMFNLTELYMRNNNLLNLSQNAFENQTLIKILDVSKNSIVDVEQNSLPLQNLQYLKIDKNNLIGTVNSNVYTPAKYLRYLDLSCFNLTKIDESAFVDSPVLATLNLSHNVIEYINPNNFKGMDNLYSLDASFNQLSGFDLNNIGSSKLKAVFLNNNKLTNITTTFLNMLSLIYIDLSYNDISDLNEVPFSKLTNLKVLRLSHNKIQIFNNPETNSLSHLTDLILSSNSLLNINLKFFKELVTVDLSNNSLSYINSSFFKNLDFLQSLDLSNNHLTQLAPGTFQNVKILKILRLSHNELTDLRYGSFKGLNRTEVLDLSYNNIVDVDVYVFHECTELSILTIDYNNIKTLDVERLIETVPKLSILSLGGNPVSCKEIVRNIKNINQTTRQVEVTSMDKIYHEDNVHGIKCGTKGDTNVILPTEAPVEATTPIVSNQSSSTGLLIWCTVLTLALVGGVVVYIIKRRRKNSQIDSRIQLRSSLEYAASEISAHSSNHVDLMG